MHLAAAEGFLSVQRPAGRLLQTDGDGFGVVEFNEGTAFGGDGQERGEDAIEVSHMVGFAVASYRENGVSGLISQGLGTSMLQIPNIMKKPVIMLPMIISSAICGPLSTCLFGLKCGASGGGMGTSGLVGVFDLLANTTGVLGIIGIFVLMFILPIILNVVISEFMRKKGFIKFGDMKLDD